MAALPKGEVHRLNTHAAPTPVTDGQSLFVYFGSLIAALDARTGAVRWEAELEDGYFDSSRHGASSSLVLSDGAVIVAQDQEAWNLDGGWMVALAVDNGEELWRQELPIAQMVATPVLDGDLLGVAGGAHNV